MKQLKKFLKLKVKADAIAEILDDLKPEALEELKSLPDQQAMIDNIVLSTKANSRKVFTPEFEARVKQLKAEEEAAGKVEQKIGEDSIVVSIPKPIKKEVYNSVTEYRNYFKD